MEKDSLSFWYMSWQRFLKKKAACFGLFVLGLFIVFGIYAPFFASSKPFFLEYEGRWYFPLFRYLFFSGYYTKSLDLFYNLLMLTLPFFLGIFFIAKRKKKLSFFLVLGLIVFQFAGFLALLLFPLKDPAFSSAGSSSSEWNKEVQSLSPYAKINLLVRYRLYKDQQESLKGIDPDGKLPTLWNMHFGKGEKDSFSEERRLWIEENEPKLHYTLMPFIRPFHWEEDAGGSKEMNRLVPLVEKTRINRKDLLSTLIFGIRVSLSVGFLSIALALAIGVPIGAFSGYYGGRADLVACRLIEIWESMPTFFMLLLSVSLLQTKSIFLVIAIIGLFGWTSFSRFVRGEFFKQKELLYVESCRALGYDDGRIIFGHLLPNALPPLLTLIPFATMAAVTNEAGLSFLGLGEENSASWGVLMDEGRTAFPSQSDLLWPPALFLMTFLIAIAVVGDGLRDAIDPKSG